MEYASMRFRPNKPTLLGLVILSFLSVGVFTFSNLRPVQAADNDFSNGITVDSTGDGADANTSDSICDDGSGNCTLRAAIEESNDEAGTQTIRFYITSTADFTNGGQDGYTIQPQSALPNITDTVIIDGYTQPGAQANTAMAPNPLNGTLLIEIEGSNAGNVPGLIADADSMNIRGLVINNFSGTNMSGIAISKDSISVQGSYIGTDPSGLLAASNYCGICQGNDDSDNAQIGGLDPEDRNIISGNADVGSSPNTASDNWTYQGNYIGVGKDGLTAVPNAQPEGSGALSLDNSDGHIIGGPDARAINVISGNRSMGIAPQNCENILIEGNYIGVGYDGTTPLGNDSSGINLSAACINARIIGNTISNSGSNGIFINESSDGTIIQGNHIKNSVSVGIGIQNSSEVLVGGKEEGEGNIVEGNVFGILLLQSIVATNNVVQGNTIKANSGVGITVIGATNSLIGGSEQGAGNTITDSGDAGIGIVALTMTAVPLTLTAQDTTILGNSITGSNPGTTDGGLGIDIFEMIDTSATPDFAPESYNNLGPTSNDAIDSDTGPNSYINFPVINSASQNLLNLNVNFDLDAADSPTNQYRVEFFANDTADPSGYGEGQTYLGSTTVSPGSSQEANLTLPMGTNLTGRVLSATTTAINGTTTSGFGSTSEFSQTLAFTVSALPQDGNDQESDVLANTGQDIRFYGLVGVLFLVTAVYIVFRYRNYTYTAGR